MTNGPTKFKSPIRHWDPATRKFVTTRRDRFYSHLHKAAALVADPGKAAELVKWLIDNGAEVNAEDKDGWTPLHNAAYQNAVSDNAPELEVVKLLIDNGAEVNAKNNDGETPLILAAQQDARSAAEVEKLLIDNGAEVNAKDKDGWTPLHFAAVFGAAELVKWLIDNGAEVNAENNDGDTPLEAAQHIDDPPTVAGVWWKDAAKVRKLLIDNGATE